MRRRMATVCGLQREITGRAWMRPLSHRSMSASTASIPSADRPDTRPATFTAPPPSPTRRIGYSPRPPAIDSRPVLKRLELGRGTLPAAFDRLLRHCIGADVRPEAAGVLRGMSKESAMDSAVVVRQPPERGYWNPVTETMPREELRGLQWHKLRTSLAHARRGSPFWRARIPDGIASLDDYIARMPILTREEIVSAEATKPPYGDFPSCDPRLAIRHHQTSGTSGRPPVRTFDTARDWAWAADMWCTGLYGMGVRPYDRAAVAFGYGLFIGFLGLHYALEKIGVATIPTGSFHSEGRRALPGGAAGGGNKKSHSRRLRGFCRRQRGDDRGCHHLHVRMHRRARRMPHHRIGLHRGGPGPGHPPPRALR